MIHKTGIEGIDRITYSTNGTPENWADTKRFFADWGLALLIDSPTQQLWETLNGAQVQVLLPSDPSLPPAIEPGPTLREVVWGVHDEETLSQIASNITHTISKSGAEAHAISVGSYQNNSIQCLDPHGLRNVFQRSAKRAIAVQGVPTNAYGHVQRINQASPIYERATPVEIGHVVLFSSCLAQAEAFYQSLGFVVSDRYPGRGSFLRCAPEAGHHDMFLLQLPHKPSGINHVAFTVRDIHEVFGGGLHMGRCGWKTQLGPGRHPISSAFFWYFENPCGGLIEYNADEDHLTAQWQARNFEPGPTIFAEWAIDGGIDGHTRRQPAVAAGTGFITERK